MSRPVLEVADIFRARGDAWRKANAGHLSLGQLKVMSAIERCRTAALGGHVAACQDCGHIHIAYNSCRNRHCPKCQGAAAKAWLEARQAELLPLPYYHVVFTLPAEIARIAYQNKRVIYGILFKASAETTLTIAADPKHLGARIGITAVLHTWGSAMTHHPHIHMIVPGGGLSLDGNQWVSCRPRFFLHVRVLSRLFRRLFLEKLVAAHEAGDLRFFNDHAALADGAAFKRYLKPLRKAEWVVYAKEPFAGPKAVLAYLSRYTHRVAISNRRLVSADQRGVTFRCKDYRLEGAARYKTMTLPTHEFIRRFLMHVLPKGFHRIRHAACPGPDPGACSPTATAPPTSSWRAACWPSRATIMRPAPRAPKSPPNRACPPILAPAAAAPWSSSKPSSRDKHPHSTANVHHPIARVTSHDGAQDTAKLQSCPRSPVDDRQRCRSPRGDRSPLNGACQGVARRPWSSCDPTKDTRGRAGTIAKAPPSQDHRRHRPAQIPIRLVSASAEAPRDFVPWRFSDACTTVPNQPHRAGRPRNLHMSRHSGPVKRHRNLAHM